jgi:PAS domain S-box-containing protein
VAISPNDAKIVEMTRFLDDLERAGRAGRTSFDQTFNSPPGGLSVHEIDTQKKFIRVSPGHRGILGYNPAEMVGRSPLDYVVMRGLSESATSRKLTPGAILAPNSRSFRKADGTEITLLQVERHLKDDLGQIIGIRTVITEAPKEG